MRVSIAIVRCALVTVIALCCRDPAPEPRAADDSERGAASEPPGPPEAAGELCGRAGEACCTAPLPACEVGAACDASSDTGRCVPATAEAELTILCRSDLDCASASTCCRSGALG